ncbi:MAG: helix-turn-helix domain-containing protein [Pseudonocardiaceae bacterium]
MSTHATKHTSPRARDHTRTTEIADLLAQLAVLMSDQPPTSETPVSRPMPERVLLTVEEAAERLHIGKTKTYALVKTGEIESILIGRLRRIHIDAIDTYTARLVSQQNTTDRSAA